MSVVQYIQLAPHHAVLSKYNDIIAAVEFPRSFSCKKSDDLELLPHSITFTLNDLDLKGRIPIERYSQVVVGHGPCSTFPCSILKKKLSV